MCVELGLREVPFQRQIRVPVRYKSVALDAALKIDLFVASEVIVELKSVAALRPIHDAQLLTYLKMTGCSLGLMFNFNAVALRQGLRRLVLTH